ncbi:MAG: OmpH family outer membrane protein [Alphaproteobacteria bacterium]|nr:OmpH family outer membrane protein [Alphaproteobacteria bacterium]
MSNILLKAGAGCGIAGLLLAGAMAYGTVPFNNTSVAVLDLDRVQQEADAYEKVKTETEKYVSALKARFIDEETALAQKGADLKKKIEAAGGKTAGFEKEIQKLNQELVEFQRKVRFESELIARAKNAAIAQVAPIAQASLKEISQKKGLSVILPRPYVTYHTENVDITDEFIKLLDGKKIQVSYPDPAQFTVPVVANQGAAQQQSAQKTEEKPTESK